MNANANAICPANGQAYRPVSRKTVLHHLQRPWARALGDVYYFCTDPDCQVVYFDNAGEYVSKDRLRMEIGQKSRESGRMICYCFDLAAADIERDPPRCREFVVEHTRAGLCGCEIRNPSGRCCLTDFPPER